MKRRSLLLHVGAAVTVLSFALAGAAGAQTKLTVYTALENEQLKPLKEAFEKATPGVEIVWVRDSTGVITARILAEKDNPKADVIWGVSVSSIALFDQQGMLAGYTPKGADMLKPIYVDSKNPKMWTGIDAYASVIVFNTKEGDAKKVAQPKEWADLTKPEYKGLIVMPNPASSGTGYLMVSAWLQAMGEKAGWEFMDRLHQNVANYTHSGSAPCVQAARGERVIGLCLDMRAASEKTKGAPIEIAVPARNGWEIEATAIVKGTKNMDAAKKLVDWTVSKQAAEIYSKTYALVAHKEVKAEPKNYPAGMEAKLVKNDFGWMGKERGRILAEWTKRYDAKSDPKK
jgi:iron(III) transport system substrate-binding protein